MRKKLLSILLSLAMVLTMIPAMESVARADSSWANPRWNDQTAEWDAYPGATKYWVYVYYNGITIGGSGHNAFDTCYNASDLFDMEGAGTYTFTVVPYANGGWIDNDESENSPEYHYVPEAKPLGSPKNLRWDGAVARWDAAENATKYRVILYKEGKNIEITSHHTVDLSESFYGYLENNGNGSYYFTVESYRDGVYNTPEQSDKNSYITEGSQLKVPENLRWEGNAAKWDAVNDADSYWIWIYKNGAPLNGDHAYSNSYDMTDCVNEYGCGEYSFAVATSKGGAHSDESPESSAALLHKGEVTTSINNLMPATTTSDGSYERTTGCGSCPGVVSTETIPKVSSVTLSTSAYAYNGKVKSPSLVIKDAAGHVLTKGRDYTFTTPSGRKNVGAYNYEVTFKGNYSGTASVKLVINPAAPSIKSMTSDSRKLTVRMAAKPSGVGASTYQIYYKQKGTNTWKKATTTSISKTIKSLKTGKCYYVKVRAYKKVGTTIYYSAWSKTVLCKKIK